MDKEVLQIIKDMSKMNKEILVIIPAYNEQENIGRIIKGVREVIPEADILVVDDGSLDTTKEITTNSGAKIISHPFNIGDGAARQTGFKYALQNNHRYLVQIDADGQHDPQSINDLLKELQKDDADIVIGSRFLKKDVYRIPFIRRAGMKLFGTIVSLAISQRITDSTSGFRAMNKEVIRFCTSDVYPDNFPDADMIILLHRVGFRIKEIPVTMHPNVKENSIHSGLKPIYYIFKMLLSILVTLLRKNVGGK